MCVSYQALQEAPGSRSLQFDSAARSQEKEPWSTSLATGDRTLSRTWHVSLRFEMQLYIIHISRITGIQQAPLSIPLTQYDTLPTNLQSLFRCSGTPQRWRGSWRKPRCPVDSTHSGFNTAHQAHTRPERCLQVTCVHTCPEALVRQVCVTPDRDQKGMLDQSEQSTQQYGHKLKWKISESLFSFLNLSPLSTFCCHVFLLCLHLWPRS